MATPRTVPQSVFDSKDAIRAARLGHEAACRELDRRAIASIPESDPNHPKFSVSV